MNKTLNGSMRSVSQSRIALWAVVAALLSLVSTACMDDAVDEAAAEGADVETAVPAAVACPLAMFPVRGRHETGYQASPDTGDPSIWTCNAANSNSDFFRRGT